MHTVLDFETLLPEFVCISDGKRAYRIYSDTELLNLWDSKDVLFVVRSKSNLLFDSICERDLPEHTSQEILIDQEVELTGGRTKGKYPKKIRRIAILHPKGYIVELLTNDFKHAASTISQLYRSRWQIETFFRNLKQNLHIKSFLGTS